MEAEVTVTLPAGAMKSLDMAVEEAILGDDRAEVARHLLMRALHDWKQSRSAVGAAQ